MTITVNTQHCVGCRLCELACSFARYGSFNPEQAAIRVTFQDDGKVCVEIAEGCDGCRRPLCIVFCPVRAIAG